MSHTITMERPFSRKARAKMNTDLTVEITDLAWTITKAELSSSSAQAPTDVELAGAIGEIARQMLKNDFRSIHTEQFLRDKLVERTQYVHERGDDMPEVKNWTWPY